MERIPTWAIIIGILMILMGSCSLHTNYQAGFNPDLRNYKEATDSFKNEFSERMADTSRMDMSDSSEYNYKQDFSEAVGMGVDKIVGISNYMITWTIRFGFIGIALSILYISGGISLFIKRPLSIKIACTALILYILFALLKIIIFYFDESKSFFTILNVVSPIFGLAIDVIFLIIILNSNTEAYKPIPSENSLV